MDPRGVLRSLGDKILVFLLLRVRVWVKGYIIDRRLKRDAKNVASVQKNLLIKILQFHRSTEYGLLHGFAGISNLEDFRKRVPIHDYEDLRPWFEKQEREQTYAINAEHPEIYTLTSGTTGKPKLIPVLRNTLKQNRLIQNFYFNYLFRARKKVADGKILTIVSPAIEGYTENSRTPFGATTGHMYASAPKLAQAKYVIPPAIFEIPDYDLRFHYILRLALQCHDITYMTSANPTTFSRLIQVLNSKWDQLMDELESGAIPDWNSFTPEQQKILRKRLVAAPRRARELRQLRAQKNDGRMRFRDVWPNIQAVGMWTGGSCAIFYERLKDEFSPETLIRDAGYHSSEFRGSSPIFLHTSAGIPSFRENFFEFAPRDSWDAGNKVFYGLHELKDGEEYYVFVTTDSGLYRYNMNDVVRVDGYYEQVPLLRFLQKGKGVTSITGEKLYENQTIKAVREVEKSSGIHSVFYLMMADEENAKYTLYYEAEKESAFFVANQADIIARDIDNALSQINLEYDAKRRSGRLSNLELVPLESGTYEAYKRECVNAGQRESQFKIIALHYKKDLKFPFANYAMSENPEPVRKSIPKKTKAIDEVQVS